jgi:hypothetical protein
MLHGWTGNLDTHLGEVQSALDSMIRTRQIGEMIAVFVNGQNALLGSFIGLRPRPAITKLTSRTIL